MLHPYVFKISFKSRQFPKGHLLIQLMISFYIRFGKQSRRFMAAINCNKKKTLKLFFMIYGKTIIWFPCWFLFSECFTTFEWEWSEVVSLRQKRKWEIVFDPDMLLEFSNFIRSKMQLLRILDVKNNHIFFSNHLFDVSADQ